MKKLIPAILSAVLIAIVVAPQQIQAANPVPFSKTIIDSSNSGDDKAVADIDGDGKPDGILGGSTAGRSLVWYDSGNNFAMHVIRSNPVYAEFSTDMQAGDIDGDGDNDIIVGDGGGSNNILWFENPRINPPAGLGSDPTVEANWTYHIVGTEGEWAHDIEIGDLNNDGRKDILTSGHGHTHLWIQNSPTSWSGKDLSSSAGSGIFIGDIDNDGLADIATPSGWLKNPGDALNGNWNKYPIDGTSGDEVLLGDLNGDGRLDVLTMNAHEEREFAWFEAPADPTSSSWSKHVIDPAMGAHHPEIADFNNDGKPDILMGLELVDLSIYLNNGEATPTFTKDQLDTTGGHNARVGDLNGDGKIDIFASDYNGYPPVRVYLNEGQFASTPIPPLTDTPTATPTAESTEMVTDTPTSTPTAESTDLVTDKPTPIPPLTDTPTATPTATFTDTLTHTSTSTPTPTDTPTFTPTATFTSTPTNTFTPTATSTDTPTSTATPTFTATPTAILPTQPPTPGALVLGLGFEEDAGGTSADSSGYNNNGTLLNGVAWTTQGKYGNALQFDGVDDRVSVADAASLDLTTGITVEAWVYPTRLNNWSPIVIKEMPSSFSYVLYGWWFGTDTTAGTYSNGERATSGGALPLNTWTHVAMTYDGAQQILYINGQAVASNNDTGALISTNLDLSIGGNSQTSNEFFNGVIDEVRIYNVALSPSDIQRDMNLPVVQVATEPAPETTDMVTQPPEAATEMVTQPPEASTEAVSPAPEQTQAVTAESTEIVVASTESIEMPSPTDTPTPTATPTVLPTTLVMDPPTSTPTDTTSPESTEEPTFTPTPTETTLAG